MKTTSAQDIKTSKNSKPKTVLWHFGLLKLFLEAVKIFESRDILRRSYRRMQSLSIGRGQFCFLKRDYHTLFRIGKQVCNFIINFLRSTFCYLTNI